MEGFASLFATTTIVMLLIFMGLAFLKAPVYRLTKANLIRLFELALAGEATESDWDVFLDVPIRYDDDLEEIRLKCVEITEQQAVFVDSQNGFVFKDSARNSLKDFIAKLSYSSGT